MREPKFFKLTVKWHGGFKHDIPVADYNLKSQLKFQESLTSSTGIDSFTYKEIPHKEYYKMIWGEYPAEPKKKRTRKKVLDENS